MNVNKQICQYVEGRKVLKDGPRATATLETSLQINVAMLGEQITIRR